jgi:tetratricopeptide (TPR) repeat protein
MRSHALATRMFPWLFVVVFFLASELAFAQHAAQPCKAPPDLQRQLAAHPTAVVYATMGAYFGQREDYPCAISAFRNSLRLKPNSPETRYYLALALLATGDPQQAARELRAALQSNPNLTKAHLTLGVALNQLNQTDAAIEEFNAVLKSDPQSVTALDWLGKSLISQQRYSAAIAVLKNGPPDEVLQMDLVIAYSKSGDNDLAIQLLSQMIEKQPSSAAAHSGLATVYTQQRRYQDAAREFQEALRLNPQDDLARVSYVKVLVLLSDFKTALPIALDYLRRNPREFDALYLTGVIDRQLGNYSEAKDMLTKTVGMQPDHYDSRYNLGLVLAKSGQPAQAREQLEKAIQLDPTSSEAHFQLAAVLRTLSLPDEAREQLQLYQRDIADRAKKDEAAAKAAQANESLQKGEFQKAIDLYHEALAQDPKDWQMFYDLALSLDRKGDYPSERNALEQAIELNPRFAAAHNQIGFLRQQAGQTADAENEFKTAIALDPHYAEAQNNLGVLYGQQGNDSEAERLFRSAIKNNPGYAQALVNLGLTLASEARFTDADSALQAALRIEPGNQEAQDARAMIRDQMREQSKAK